MDVGWQSSEKAEGSGDGQKNRQTKNKLISE